MIESPLALATTIAAATALAFWLDYRVPALGKVGASMLALIFGAILSNTGLVPVESGVYDAVFGPVTSVAIAWLLLSVNLRDLRKAGPRMVGAFGVAVAGTVLGAFVAAAVYGAHFGDDTMRMAGALFAGLNAADAVVTGLWLAACLVLPLWIGRFYAPVKGVDDETASPPAETESTTPSTESERHARHPYFAREGLSALSIAKLVAAGLILVFVAEWLGEVWPAVPSILWLTTLALALGHSPLFRDARGAMQLGSVGLHFFFVLIGIVSRWSEIAAVGVEVFLFTLIVVAVHAVFVLGVGRLLRLDMGTVAVASQAAVGGPSSALAVAISRQWRHLVLPGVVVGLLGYAVGTYLGFGVAAVLR